MAKNYYHVIEEASYGNIGWHGCYTTAEEAKKQADRLSDFFPNLYYYVFHSTSKKEPEFITV